MKRALVLVAALATLVPSIALAQSAPLVRYTVQQPIRCDDLAEKLWGDRTAYDRIHANNPWLGPQPHLLKPGTVLTIPAPTAGVTTGDASPDARLHYVRNHVDVEAPEPRPGKANDPLFRGNRVGTSEASLAQVGFRDTTTLWLGERSLVVILGDTRSKVGQADEATLVNGSLRAFLGAGATNPVAVQSGGARAIVAQGEAQVSLDASKTTRLAQYKGSGQLASAGKTTKLTGGFGSKALDKKAPTPPKPLPAPPVWSRGLAALTFTAQPTTDVSAEYQKGVGPGDPIASYHVQLAKDAEFKDLVVDTRVPATVAKLEARALTEGAYFARVSAIDDDEFEGPYGAPTTTEVVVAQQDAEPHVFKLTVPTGKYACSVDGAAPLPVTEPLRLRRTRAHHVECTSADGATSAFELPADKLTPRAALVSLSHDGDGAGTVSFSLLDAEGAAVPDASLAMAPSPGVEWSPPVARGGGRYEARVRWAKGKADLATAITVNDQESAPTGPLSTAPAIAPPGASATGASKSNEQRPAGVGGELFVAADGSVGASPLDGGAGASIGFAVVVPTRAFELSVGARGGYERTFGAGADRDVLHAALPVVLRLGHRDVRPTFELAPLVARSGTSGRADALLFGGEARVGVDVAIGASAAFFANVGGRVSTTQSTREGDASLTGFIGAAGLRLGF